MWLACLHNTHPTNPQMVAGGILNTEWVAITIWVACIYAHCTHDLSNLPEICWYLSLQESYARRCFNLIDEYAPGFSSSVIGYDMLAPPDLEREIGLTGISPHRCRFLSHAYAWNHAFILKHTMGIIESWLSIFFSSECLNVLILEYLQQGVMFFMVLWV